jgi:hypothetical protein
VLAPYGVFRQILNHVTVTVTVTVKLFVGMHGSTLQALLLHADHPSPLPMLRAPLTYTRDVSCVATCLPVLPGGVHFDLAKRVLKDAKFSPWDECE